MEAVDINFEEEMLAVNGKDPAVLPQHLHLLIATGIVQVPDYRTVRVASCELQ
jgi:hypothetical protein